MQVSEQHTSAICGLDAKLAPAKLARLQVNATLEARAPFHPVSMRNYLAIESWPVIEKPGLTSSNEKSCSAVQGRRNPACQRTCRAQRRVSASSATVEAPAATNQVLATYASLSVKGSLQARKQD